MHQSESIPCFRPVLLLASHPGPAHITGSWHIWTPLTGCGCESTQQESRRVKMSGCSSRGTCLSTADQHAKLYYLEAITCRCPLLTQLSRMQLTCILCSSQLKEVHEATLGRGSLELLISVCNMGVIAHTPQQKVSSLLDNLVVANRKKPARGVLEETPIFWCSDSPFQGAFLSPFWLQEKLQSIQLIWMNRPSIPYVLV